MFWLRRIAWRFLTVVAQEFYKSGVGMSSNSGAAVKDDLLYRDIQHRPLKLETRE
ncbi:MAG: hypothetical protein ABSF61_02255 [Anaerolineales bacterium]